MARSRRSSGEEAGMRSSSAATSAGFSTRGRYESFLGVATSSAGLVDERDAPVAPWHPIQGPSDASTMWYAVLRKRERGVFIGTLCIRHTGRQASLEEAGWEEVPVERIGL